MAASMGLVGVAAGAALVAWLGWQGQARRWADAAAEAFESALIIIDDGFAALIGGKQALAACANALGLKATADVREVIDALRATPDLAKRVDALFTEGEACAFEVRGARGVVWVEGRSAGALAWLRLSPTAPERGGLPSAARLAAFIDARRDPAWI
ncbi:MAG: hypothetical protein M3T55_06185, partial [Pseudomonadota bacterium]|nr:hypothetical protein [Pseudomonadota bacterium]